VYFGYLIEIPVQNVIATSWRGYDEEILIKARQAENGGKFETSNKTINLEIQKNNVSEVQDKNPITPSDDFCSINYSPNVTYQNPYERYSLIYYGIK